MTPSYRSVASWWVGAAALLAFVTLTVLVEHGSSGDLDGALTAAAVRSRRPWLTAVAWWATSLGAAPVLWVLAVGVGLIVWCRARRWSAQVVLALVVVPVADHVVVFVKGLVDRPRPGQDLLLGPVASDPSFPSGHTCAGAVMWWVTAMLLSRGLTPAARRWITAAAVAITVLIGWSRVYLGYHWASDVLGGWLLAAVLVSAAQVTVALAAARRRRPVPALTVGDGCVPLGSLQGPRH